MQGRFSMHLWPRKIRKVAVKKAVRVFWKVSLKQKLFSWLLLSFMRQYKWRVKRATVQVGHPLNKNALSQWDIVPLWLFLLLVANEEEKSCWSVQMISFIDGQRAWEFFDTSLVLSVSQRFSGDFSPPRTNEKRLHTCGQRPGGVRFPCQGLLILK